MALAMGNAALSCSPATFLLPHAIPGASPLPPARVGPLPTLPASPACHMVAAASARGCAPPFHARLGGGGGGGGVLERPGLDQTTTDPTPRTSEGAEMGESKQRVRLGGGERFLLLDHVRHTESQVAKVLPRVVPQVTPDEARRCFFESRETGLAIVTVAVKEHAEFYAQMMARNGLRSSIEPDQSTI